MKAFLLGLLYASIIGCSMLGGTSLLTSALKPDDGVSVDAQIGKENTQQVVGQQNETINEVGGDQNTITVMNQNIPVWYIFLLILGWMLPSPQEIWRGLKSLIKKGGVDGNG